MRLAIVVLVVMALAPVAGASSQGPQPIFGAEAPAASRFPLCFAFGVSDPEQLSEYRAAGFSCVFLEAKRSYAEADWEKFDALISAAQEHGLWVVIRLETTMASAPVPGAVVSVVDQRYLAQLNEWAKQVIGRYRALPNLLGWATSALEEEVAWLADTDFQYFLLQAPDRVYPSMEALNQDWGSHYTRSDQITLGDDKDYVASAGLGDRRTLMIAAYKYVRVRSLARVWAQIIRSADSAHFLLSGECLTYRSLAWMPPEYDVLLSAAFPVGTEGDSVFANSHAIDMARRGGRFLAVTLYAVASIDAGSEGQAQVGRWVRNAFLHGARGVAFDDWGRLRARPELLQEVSEALAEVKRAGGEHFSPKPGLAILYQPFAGGSLESGPGPYGLAAHQALEPGRDLYRALRGYTIAGGVDYLTEDEVRDFGLGQYRVVLAPSALSVNDATQHALVSFVQQGGVLLADLGFGAFQTGSFLRPPPDLQGDLFGIQNIPASYPRSGDMYFRRKSDLFPSLEPGEGTSSPPTLAGADSRPGQRPYTFRGPIAEAAVMAGTDVIGDIPHPRRRRERLLYSGLLGRKYGQGMALFATVNLWGNWWSQDPVFQKFHADLAVRSGQVRLEGVAGLASPVVSVAVGEGQVALLNLTSRLQATSLMSSLGDGRLFADRSLNEVETEPGKARLIFSLQPGELVLRRVVAVRVTQASAPTTLTVERCDGREIVLTVWGANCAVGLDERGYPTASATAPADLTIEVQSGRYSVGPWTLHHLETKPLAGGETKAYQLRADAAGKLTITGRFLNQRLTIVHGP